MLQAESPHELWRWSGSWPHLPSPRSRVGFSIVVASSIAWRRLTSALTSSVSLGRKGANWSTIVLKAKALCANVR
jgi:hypothetical protein